MFIKTTRETRHSRMGASLEWEKFAYYSPISLRRQRRIASPNLTNGIEENSVSKLLGPSADCANVKERQDDLRPLDLSTKDASDVATLPTIFYSSLDGSIESLSWIESLKRKKFPGSSEDSEGISEFHLSCTLREPGFARAFLDNGADANSQASRLNPGFTPLHFAVKGCSLKVIDLLLRRGADPNRQDAAGKTPLHLVCEMIDQPFYLSTVDAKAIVDLLLRHEASSVVADADGRTPLHVAFYFSLYERDGACCIFNQLIKATTSSPGSWGAINHADPWGLSLLHIAASESFDEVMMDFLNAGADVNSRVSSGPYAGFTALHFGAMNNRSLVVYLLLENGADPNAQEDLTGATPLQLACKRLHEPGARSPLAIVKTLVGKKASSVFPDRTGRTPLHECFYAANKESSKVFVQLLPAMGLQLDNVTDEHGLSVFHIICTTRKYNLIDFADLDVDGRPTSGVFKGYTALHFACMFNQVTAVKFLLERKAKVNVRAGEAGVTPLHLACEFSYRKFLQDVTTAERCCADQVEIVDLLLEHGADVHARDSLGFSALHYACMLDKNHNEDDWDELHEHMPSVASDLFKEVGRTMQRIIPAFVEHNVDIGTRTRDESTIMHLIARHGNLQVLEEVVNLLGLLGVDFNATDAAGRTALHVAVRSGNKMLVRSLLENRADPNIKCKESAIPLNVVCQQIIDLSGESYTSEKRDAMKDMVETLRTLLDNGSDVNVKTPSGRIVLHEIMKIGLCSCVTKALLRYRADVNMKDSSGKSFLHYLYKHTNPEIQKFMKFFDPHLSWSLALSMPLNQSVKDYLEGSDLDYKTAVMAYDKRFESDSCYSKCRMELQRMNEVQIESHTTLYDILWKRPQTLINLVENKVLVEIMKSDDLEAKFPYYCHLLRAQFKRGLQRRVYAGPAEAALCSVLNLYLPNLCTQKILEYLPNTDVHNLMKAAPLKKGEKRKLCDV